MPFRRRGLRSAALAAGLIALGLGLARAAELDPRLRARRDQGGAKGTSAAGAPESFFPALLRVAPGVPPAALAGAHPAVRFGGAAGEVITAEIPASALDGLAADPRVLRLQMAVKAAPQLEVARSSTVAGGLIRGLTRGGVSELANATGAGVVVGIVDTGIDFKHGDFVTAANASRLLWLWDQTDGGGAPGATPASPYNYGTEWTQAQLTADIQNGTSIVRQTDTVGHGTHVAGIAAGDGDPDALFKGLAPEADLIVVKTDFFTNKIVDALGYIRNKAAAAGKRAVINLSLGTQAGPHDGTDTFEAGVNAIAASTPVVVSMGNDGAKQPHAQASFASGQALAFRVQRDASITDADIEFWHPSGDAYTAVVTFNGVSGAVGAAANVDVTTGSLNGHDVEIYNRTNTGHPSGDKQIYVYVHRAAGITVTTMTVTLTRTANGGSGRVDGFVDPAAQSLNFLDNVSASLTLTAPAAAADVFAVGSFASRQTWRALDGNNYLFNDQSSLGALSAFSSRGPTRDGRTKPDVVAPGDVVGSAMSAASSPAAALKLGDNRHLIQRGTSMAAPMVTGMLAARLQGKPSSTVSQLRAVLRTLARTDSATGSVPNDSYGYGKATASPQPIDSPVGLAAATQGSSSITWSWSDVTVAADSYSVAYATNSGVFLASSTLPPFTQTGLLPNATYGVMIRGRAAGVDGPGTFITTATFAAAPLAAPAVTAHQTSVTVTLANCGGACSGYVAEVSASQSFTGAVLSAALLTSTPSLLQISGLSAGSTYYARLAHLNSMGGANFGPSGQFVTLPGLFAPGSPAIASVSTGSLVFSWTQGENAPGLVYTAQLSTAADFSGTLQTVAASAFSAGFTGLAGDTSYYARVRASTGPFATAGPQVTLPREPAAAAFQPAGTGSISPAWTANGNAADSLYRAELSASASFSPLLASSVTRNAGATFTGLTPNTVYHARVLTIGRTGTTSAYAALGSSATLASVPTLPAQPLSGLGANGFTLTFNSGGNPAGTRYLVRVATHSSFTSVSASTATADTQASFAGLTSNKLYFAQAAALNQFDAPTAFTSAVSTATLPAAPLTASTPVSTRAAASMTVAWAAGTLAAGTTYQAELSASPAFASGVQSSSTLNAFASFAGLAANTFYYARVRALSANAPNPDGPYLVYAASGATLANQVVAAPAVFSELGITSVTVSWLAPLSGAVSGYRVELSPQPDFASGVISSAVASSQLSAAMTGLTYGTTYFARVASLNLEGLPNYLDVGSTRTVVPALSSGTVAGGGLALSVPPAFPQLSSIRLEIPSGAFPAGTQVSAVANIGVDLDQARSNDALIRPLGDGVGIEITAQGLQPGRAVRVSMVYDSARIPAGEDPRRLHLMRYDPGSGLWVLVPSQTDAKTRTLTAFVPHFSTFAPFFVTAASDLSAVQVYPQPWEIGDASSRYWAGALTFSSLPAGARVRVLTITGEQLWSGEASAGGVAHWDGSNRFGGKAASGTYIVLIEAGGRRFVRRVVLIR